MFFIIALILSIAIFSDLSLSTIFSLALYIHPDLIFIFQTFFNYQWPNAGDKLRWKAGTNTVREKVRHESARFPSSA